MDAEDASWGGAGAIEMSIPSIASEPGGDETLGRLLDEHRDVVLSMVARYATPGVESERLVGAAVEGLLDAASRFDSSCGPFGPFAAWWVRRRVARTALAI